MDFIKRNAMNLIVVVLSSDHVVTKETHKGDVIYCRPPIQFFFFVLEKLVV